MTEPVSPLSRLPVQAPQNQVLQVPDSVTHRKCFLADQKSGGFRAGLRGGTSPTVHAPAKLLRFPASLLGRGLFRRRFLERRHCLLEADFVPIRADVVNVSRARPAEEELTCGRAGS